MAITLAMLPTGLVELAADLPDRDSSFVVEDLIRYFRHFDPLPAITVVVRPEGVFVTRGHKYLAAARSLGRPRIRAVIASSEDSESVRRLLADPSVVRLDWETIREHEASVQLPLVWHVFRFARPLDERERAAFAKLVADLHGYEVPVEFEADYGEFEARTPVSDSAWAAKHLQAVAGFSGHVVAVVSYQGRRFNMVA